jgi:hypothetical protein
VFQLVILSHSVFLFQIVFCLCIQEAYVLDLLELLYYLFLDRDMDMNGMRGNQIIRCECYKYSSFKDDHII